VAQKLHKLIQQPEINEPVSSKYEATALFDPL